MLCYLDCADDLHLLECMEHAHYAPDKLGSCGAFNMFFVPSECKGVLKAVDDGST